VGDERKYKRCIGCNWGLYLIRVVGAMGCKVGSYIQRLGDAMSAQSKAMYWQARAMELETMERMAEALEAIRTDSVHSPICFKRNCSCVNMFAEWKINDYAAMKGGK